MPNDQLIIYKIQMKRTYFWSMELRTIAENIMKFGPILVNSTILKSA